MQALLPPAMLGDVDVRLGPVPSVGEHTGAVLAELGRDAHEIEALRSRGVV